MKHTYDLPNKESKKKKFEISKFDLKVIIACACISTVGIFIAYSYATSTASEYTGAPETGSRPEVQTEVSEVPSNVSSMMEAGNAVADAQNNLIAENDKYKELLDTASSIGYDEQVVIPESYQTALDNFNKKYMKDNPQGVSSVLWADTGVWEFNGDYDYPTELNTSMLAVWILYGKDDVNKQKPYAIVTAKYITASNQFTEARFRKTDWYPNSLATLTDEQRLAGMEEDPTVCADQCDDSDVTNGGNDDGDITDEQKKVHDELQMLLDAENPKDGGLSLTH